jgi:integrase
MKNKLTATQVKKIAAGKQLSDGGGLRVGRNKSGSIFFTYRYSLNGKQHSIGIGGAGTTLKEARAKRDEFERHVQAGVDPKQRKAIVELQAKAERQAEVLGDEGPTFRTVFEQFWVDRKRDSLGPEKDKRLWRNSVYTYLEPILDLPINLITPAVVADAIRPMWKSKNETIDRTRSKADQAYKYALAKGITTQANPFDIRTLKYLLPEVSDSERHHEAIDFIHLPQLYKNIQQALLAASVNVTATHALQMILLTALRFSNGAGIRPEWISQKDSAIAIPASMMKGRRPSEPDFLVPITEPMVGIIEARAVFNELRHSNNKLAGQWLFPQEFRQKDDRQWDHITDNVVRETLRKLNPDEDHPRATTHGLRSAFKEWCAENDVPDDVSERCLDHRDENKVRAAYLRSDLWSKRQRVMDDWARFLTGKKS